MASTNFFLPAYIKGKLVDYHSESREELVNAITVIFAGVDQEMLLWVFESCAKRLKWVMRYGEKYDTA
jgi:hypothetical protein